MEEEIIQRISLLKTIILEEINSYEDYQASKEFMVNQLCEIEKFFLQKPNNNQPPQEIKKEIQVKNNSLNLNSFKNSLNFNYDEDSIIPNNTKCNDAISGNNNVNSQMQPSYSSLSKYNSNIPYINEKDKEKDEDLPIEIINENNSRKNNHSLIERDEDDEKDEFNNIESIVSNIIPENTNTINSRENEPSSSLLFNINNNNINTYNNSYYPTPSLKEDKAEKNQIIMNNTYQPSKPSFIPYPNTIKDNHFNLPPNSLPSSPTRRNKQKATRVADILMKLNSNDILNEIIGQIFSKEIFDELLSSKVDIELIESIENTIIEIEKLEKEEKENIEKKNSHLSHNIQTFSEKSELPQSKTFDNYSKYTSGTNKQKKLNNISLELMKKYPKTSKTIFGSINTGKDNFNFSNSLRKSKANSSIKGRTFVNYTSPSSGYFDPSLQNGGQSKLKSVKRDKSLSKREAISPVKRYIESNRLYNKFQSYYI